MQKEVLTAQFPSANQKTVSEDPKQYSGTKREKGKCHGNALTYISCKRGEAGYKSKIKKTILEE